MEKGMNMARNRAERFAESVADLNANKTAAQDPGSSEQVATDQIHCRQATERSAASPAVVPQLVEDQSPRESAAEQMHGRRASIARKQSAIAEEGLAICEL
jgi:hypothetical protein